MFEGPVLRLLIRLSLPILAGMVFQLLYNITDTIWISRIDLNDPSYVGGTGIIFPFLFVAIALGNGIMVGTSSLVARSIGRGNDTLLNKTAESGLAIAFILAVILTVLCYTFDKEIISLLGAEGDYFIHALEYFRFIIPTGMVAFLSYVFFGIVQGEGQMKYLMNGMIFGTAANIILDPVFIFLLKMDVRGAALATTLSQIFSFGYILSVFLRKKTSIHIEWKIRNIDFSIIKNISSIGFPQALGMMLMGFSFFIYNRVVVEIDPKFLTAFTLCGRFDQAVLMPIFAIGSALLTMVGQNAGRGNFRRISDIWKVSLLSSSTVVLILAAVMVILAPKIYPFFTDIDEVVRYTVLQTRIIEFTFIFAAVGILARSFYQAIGHPMPALLIILLRLVVIAIPAVLLYVYVFGLGVYGVWLGMITGNVISAVVSLFLVKGALKKLQTGALDIIRVKNDR